jgi:hypothetical protein
VPGFRPGELAVIGPAAGLAAGALADAAAAGRLAALLAPARLRSTLAKPAGPNLSIPFGCMFGSIWARANDNTTPMAHSDISRAEPP